jgi:DNA integrity scanning protein DisA with diadenylate cyclase activity
LDKKYAIKDTFLLKQIIDEVEKYRKKLNALGTLINQLNVWELEERLNEPEPIAWATLHL